MDRRQPAPAGSGAEHLHLVTTEAAEILDVPGVFRPCSVAVVLSVEPGGDGEGGVTIERVTPALVTVSGHYDDEPAQGQVEEPAGVQAVR